MGTTVGLTLAGDRIAFDDLDVAETLAVSVAPVGDEPAAIPSNTPTAYFISEDATAAIALPYAPNSYKIGGLAPEFSTIARAGDKPLTVFSNLPLLTVSLDLYISPKQPKRVLDSVSDYLTELRKYIRQRKRWAFIIDGQLSGTYWYFTQADLTGERRRQTDNELTAATVSVTLTEASDTEITTGPTTGGVVASDPDPEGATNRTYTVKSGDVLWSIAVRFLGDGRRWTEIATLNGITDPRTLQVGKVLRIPSNLTATAQRTNTTTTTSGGGAGGSSAVKF